MKNALYTTFNDAFLETGATMIYSFLDNNSKDEGKQFIQIAEILKVPLTDSLQYNKI